MGSLTHHGLQTIVDPVVIERTFQMTAKECTAHNNRHSKQISGSLLAADRQTTWKNDLPLDLDLIV